ncbi:signal transduction histidine kinase [Rhodoplanes tepidamans]|nr:signal transduction histidine kinase [Rhodoplanes tepidamans]
MLDTPVRRPTPMSLSKVLSLPWPVLGLAYLAGYVLLDWVSFLHPFAPFGITPWNPPTGLSFVLVLLFGQRMIPLLFVAPILADLLVRHLPLPWTTEFRTAAVIGGGYAVGLIGLLQPKLRFNPTLGTMRDLVLLLVVAGASAAVVSVAYVGLTVDAGLLPLADLPAAAVQYWVGDMIGIAIVAPFGLILLTRGRTVRLSVETAVQVAATLVALALVFVFAERHHSQLFYVLFLPIIWMAVRGGLEAVTVGVLLTQLGLIAGVHLLPGDEVDVTGLQALMLVLAMTGLIAGALVTQNRRTALQLRLHQDSLARLARLGSMGELATAIAHEINQPLTAAGTYTRLVAETLRDDPHHLAVSETADKAAAQVQRAADVVRRLRALIRLDQSGRAPVPVARIVRETLELMHPELDRHGITVTARLAEDLPPVLVDILQIEQVLLNLIRNAVEAIDGTGASHGSIVVSAAAEGDMVAIAVADSGPGFPPDFPGPEGSTFGSSKADGLGFGLSLCRSIVEAHRGRLTVDQPTRGAVVRFTIPVAKVSDD